MPAIFDDRCECGGPRRNHNDQPDYQNIGVRACGPGSSCGCTGYRRRPPRPDMFATTAASPVTFGTTTTNTPPSMTISEWEVELTSPSLPDPVLTARALEELRARLAGEDRPTETGRNQDMPAPRRPDNRYVRTGQCRDENDGDYCTAARNHTGMHRNYWMRGTYSREWAAVPPRDSAPPDNRYEALHSQRCLDRDGGYACHARRGHTGEHRGYFARGGWYHAWPNNPVGNGFESDSDIRCRDRSPVGYGVCFARRGHTGEHIAYSSVGNAPGSRGRWPNGADPTYERDSTLRCLESDPRREYQCFARRGHTGEHVGYGYDGTPPSRASGRWSQAPADQTVWLSSTGRERSRPWMGTDGRYLVCPGARDGSCSRCSQYVTGSYLVVTRYAIHPAQAVPLAVERAKLVPRKTPGPNLPERLLELLACSGSMTSGDAVKITGDPFCECTMRRLADKGLAAVDKTTYPHKYSYIAPVAEPAYKIRPRKGQRRVPKPVG